MKDSIEVKISVLCEKAGCMIGTSQDVEIEYESDELESDFEGNLNLHHLSKILVDRVLQNLDIDSAWGNIIESFYECFDEYEDGLVKVKELIEEKPNVELKDAFLDIFGHFYYYFLVGNNEIIDPKEYEELTSENASNEMFPLLKEGLDWF